MKAMILAAGFGTRLRPLTDTIPKPLVPVAGVPNIVWVIERLKEQGIEEFVINLHYLPEPIQHLLDDGSGLGVSIRYSMEPEILGTGGGIKKMLQMVGNETCLAVNGDVLFTPNIASLLDIHRQSERLSTMIVRKAPNAVALGAVGLDKTGRVRRLVGAGKDREHLQTYMFTGVHIIEPELYEYLPDQGCIVRNTYIPLVETDGLLFGAASDAYFCDLGTPDSYIAANSQIAKGELALPGFSPGTDGVIKGNDIHLETGASIGPGCVVGDNAVIKAGVTIENTVVMPGATVSQSQKNAIVHFDGSILRP